MLSQTRWLVWVFLLQDLFSGFGKVQAAGEIISRKGDGMQEFKKDRVDRNRLETNNLGQAKLSSEDLRTRLHLYSRLDKPKMVEEIGDIILQRHPRDPETLHLLASFYLERKDAPRSLKYAHALVKFHPDDEEGHMLLAMAYRLDGQPRLAQEVLTELRAKKFQHRNFPYEAELAAAALASGDWPQAIRSYQEAIENPVLQPEARGEAQNQLQQLRRLHLPQVSLKETSTLFKSGLILRSALDWSEALSVRHRLHFEADRDDLKLNEAEALRPHWTSRNDVSARITSDFRAWRTSVYGGVGDAEAIYGGTLTRVLGEDRDLVLALHGNQRATDSLLLEMLHGREDELFLLWHTRFYPDVFANMKLRGRQITIDGETLGYGYSVDLTLERVILKNVPELHFGYRGLVAEYSQESVNLGLVDEVVLPDATASDRRMVLKNLVSSINLHGIFLSWEKTINPEWSWHGLAGIDYSFTRSSFGESIEAGLSYFPSPNTELIFSAGYSTSASTSEQDTERLELSLGLRWRF